MCNKHLLQLTRGPAEKVSVFENKPGSSEAVSGRLSHLSGLWKNSKVVGQVGMNHSRSLELPCIIPPE